MQEKKKSQEHTKKHASLDGIISDGRRLGVPGVARSSGKKLLDTPSIEHVSNQEEGFHPMRSSSQSLGQDASKSMPLLLDEPIALDEAKPTKKRLRLRWHRPRFHRPKPKTLLKRAGLTLLAIILLFGLYIGIKFYQTERNVFRGGGGAPGLSSNADVNQLKGEGDGRVNILLLGIGGPGHDGRDLTDTIMIASVDPVTNKVDLLSIPRDLWVSIPGDGYQKINAAYVYGKQGSSSKSEAGKTRDGLRLLDKALAPVIGINIHYHIVVDFKAFKDMVNAVGGVTFNVPETLYDPSVAWENNWSPIIAQKGTRTMEGAQALLYARSRETSSDFARGERQRLLLVALKEKILSVGTFSNPLKVSSLLNSFGSNIFTDFSLSDMNKLYQIINKVPSSDIKSLDLITPPHNFLTTAAVGNLSTVQPRAGIFNYAAIVAYIRSTLRDGYIAKENATIAIYNATNTAGLATTTSKKLKSYGYNVTTVDSTKTASNPPSTVIVDLSGGRQKYTLNYLEKRFKVTSVGSIPAGSQITPPLNTDFVIIIGQDVATSG